MERDERYEVSSDGRIVIGQPVTLGAYFVHLRDLKFNDAMGDLKVYDALRKKESKGILTDDEKTQIAIIRDAIRQNRKFPEKVKRQPSYCFHLV